MNATPPPRPEALGERVGQGIGRFLELVFTVLASAVFVILWVYVAAAAVGDGRLLTDTWVWLSGLDTIAAIVVWVAILPVAVFVWAWQAELDGLLMSLVMVGLVAWTGVALRGLVKLLHERLVRRAA